MAEDSKNRTATIAIVTAIVALILGLCLGAILGGLGGYLLGRSSAAAPAPVTQAPRIVLTPRPGLPLLPGIPTPERLRPGMIPRGGALIQQVVDGTPAAAAGLRRNDLITQVDGTAIDASHRLVDVLAGYKPGDTVTLTVWRAGSTSTIKVTLGQHPDDAAKAYLGIQYAEVGAQQPTPQPGD